MFVTIQFVLFVTEASFKFVSIQSLCATFFALPWRTKVQPLSGVLINRKIQNIIRDVTCL